MNSPPQGAVCRPTSSPHKLAALSLRAKSAVASTAGFTRGHAGSRSTGRLDSRSTIRRSGSSGLAILGRVSVSKRTELDALIADATLDCYNDSECVTGFHTMIGDNLAMPFKTEVLGVEVTVTRVDLTDDVQIAALCTRGRARQRIPILDLPLPTPPPDGAEWIEAYRQWWKP